MSGEKTDTDDTDDLALARGVAWGVVLAVPFWTAVGWLVW